LGFGFFFSHLYLCGFFSVVPAGLKGNCSNRQTWGDALGWYDGAPLALSSASKPNDWENLYERHCRRRFPRS
jgi:hypothetical protein